MEDKKDPPGQKSVAEIEIPDLKKGEKEKKKGGIAWGSTGNGTSFVGAKGAAGAASSAARAAGAAASRAAATAVPQAVGAAAPAFISTIAGKIILVAGIALLGGGSAIMVSRSRNVSATPALGAISATIKAPKPETDARALYFAARAAKGQLRFARTKKDEQTAKERAAAEAQASAQAAAAQAAAEAAEEARQKEEEMAGGPEGGIESVGNGMTDQMEHNLSGAKLSTDLGKQFKGKDIFENAPKFGEGFGKEKLDKFSGHVRDKGRAGRMTSAKISGNGKISMRGGKKFSDSLGHLDGMNKFSSKMYKGKKMEDGKEMSTTQFENTQMTEGVAPPPSTVDDMAPPPNPPSAGSGPISTQEGTSTDVGGYQSQISQAQNLANKSSSNNILGIAMVALGTILAIIGYGMLSWGWLPGIAAAAWYFIIAGLLMVAGGGYALSQSKQQAGQANTAVQGTGQSYQAQQAQKCIADALANHTSADKCNVSTEVKPLTDPLPEPVQQSPLPTPPSED